MKKPWGEYIVLVDEEGYKVKTLIVNPGESLSLQSHTRREEHWIVVAGEATVTIATEEHILLRSDHILIPISTVHRLSNNGTSQLIVIEVQTGSYFGEDDIIRYEDKYGRVE